MTSFIREVRKAASPWWNRKLAEARFSRLLAFIEQRSDIFAPVLFDIGARWGISPPYDRLEVIHGFQSVGFEPDATEASKLEAAGAFHRVCSKALGKSKVKKSLHIAKDPGSSTLFPPDMTEIARHTTSLQFETVRRLEISVEPLDDVIISENLPYPDFMKIDCEGAEAEILEGASKTLSTLCGLTFEARILEFYKGGATLGPLLDYMFKCGFICLKMDPVGEFFGCQMMFDVVMVRHPESICDSRQFLLCLLFCLLHGNWQYAHRTAFLRASDFDCDALIELLKR